MIASAGSSGSNIETEFGVSPKGIIAILAFFGLLFVLLSDTQPEVSARLELLYLTVVLYTVSVIAWLLDSWKPQIGRWFVVIALLGIVNLGLAWLDIPGFLSLFAIPTVLAAALISLSAATVVTLLQSTLLLALSPQIAVGANPVTVVLALASIWTILGLMFAVYRPMSHITRWSWRNFQQAQTLLEEARDRKAELEQILDDLANANRQLALLNEKQAAMRVIAEEAQKTKAAFVAKVSHEFRTPLSMIIGLTDLLLETPKIYDRALPPRLLEDLQIVHRNCEHLSSLIDDVLDLSQIEAGHFALHREPVDLAQDIENSVTVVRPLLESKKLSLEMVVPVGLPKIYCDRTRIRQVILNLISNAVRFTDKGGIRIEVTQQAQDVIFSVNDTGPGISSQEAERIFEPFCQGSNNPWRDNGGSGLGLSISKQFVELHGGRIWLESKPGLGSTFFFKLPAIPPKSTVSRPQRWLGEDWVWSERRSKPRLPSLPFKQRIVMCDETGELASLWAHNTDEVEFIATRNLTEVQQELQQCPAHAVVLNTTSSQNLQLLVQDARVKAPDTPIIACSFSSPLARAQAAGAFTYLMKPVTREKLREAIEAIPRPVRQILVVDDNPDVQQLLARMINAYDNTIVVTTASSGEQALQELKARPPDLMLLDIVMPGLDGWQVLELMDQDGTVQTVPVIILSAQDPAAEPATSQLFLASMGQGVSASKLLRCSLELSALLLKPD